MSDMTIRATLGLENTDWQAKSAATQASLEGLRDKATLTKAAVALLEQEFVNGKGTAEQIKRHRELRAEFVQTEQAAKRMATQLAAISAATPAAPKAPTPAPTAPPPRTEPANEPHGGGNTRMRNQELAHSARSVIDMLGAGANPLQALQMEAPRIVQAFGGGIGAIMGVGAAVAGITALIEKTVEAGEKAKELKRDFQEALRAGPISGQQSAAAISSRIDELDSILHKNGPVTGVMSRVGQFVSDRLASSYEDLDSGDFGIHVGKNSGHDAGRERADLVRQAELRRREMLASEVKAQTEGNDLRERGFTQGQDTVSIAGIDRKMQEQVAAQEEKMGLPKLREDFVQARTPEERERIATEYTDKARSFHEQKGQIERGGGIDKEEEQRRQQSAAIAVQAEEKIVGIKREGLDVDVQIAKARLEAADAALKNGPAGGLENEQLQAAVNAATQEVEQAEKVTAEKHNQLQLEAQIASLRGSSDQVRQRTLDLERSDIERRKQTAKPDEMPGINRDLARNQQQTDEFVKSQNLRFVDREETEDRARTGRGPEAQVGLIDKELGRNEERRSWNTNENGGDPDVAAQLDLHAAELKRTKEDIQFAEEQTLKAAQAQTNEMTLQATGQTHAAQVASIRASYEERIANALHNGNTELAAQLGVQQQLATNAANLAEYRKTPAQHAAERWQQQKDATDTKNMQAQQEHHLSQARLNYEEDNRAKLPMDPDARRKAIEAAVPDPNAVKTLPTANRAAATSTPDADSTAPATFDATNPFAGPAPLTLAPSGSAAPTPAPPMPTTPRASAPPPAPSTLPDRSFPTPAWMTKDFAPPAPPVALVNPNDNQPSSGAPLNLPPPVASAAYTSGTSPAPDAPVVVGGALGHPALESPDNVNLPDPRSIPDIPSIADLHPAVATEMVSAPSIHPAPNHGQMSHSDIVSAFNDAIDKQTRAIRDICTVSDADA